MSRETCAWVFDRAPKKGQRCQVKPIEGRKYCSKHTQRTAARETRQSPQQRLAADDVFGDPAAAKHPTRNKFSVFNFTFSTNRDVEKLSREQKLAFKSAVDDLFEADRILTLLVDQTNEDPEQNIVESKTLHRYEVGSQQHRLHAHCQLLLEHTGHYRIDQAALRADLKKLVGYTVYVKVDAQTDHAAAYAAYIKKQDESTPYNFDNNDNDNIAEPPAELVRLSSRSSNTHAPTSNVDLPERARKRTTKIAPAREDSDEELKSMLEQLDRKSTK